MNGKKKKSKKEKIENMLLVDSKNKEMGLVHFI